MMREIFLAGGCFWGIQAYFKRLRGVISTEAGYANGNMSCPSYEDLKEHIATHAETVRIIYDDRRISLEQIIDHLLRIINPYSVDRQGGDVGHQYRTGIYYTDEADRSIIFGYLHSREQAGGRPFAIEVKPLDNYYRAEEYHQDYLDKHPMGYCHVDFSKIRPQEKK